MVIAEDLFVVLVENEFVVGHLHAVGFFEEGEVLLFELHEIVGAYHLGGANLADRDVLKVGELFGGAWFAQEVVAEVVVAAGMAADGVGFGVDLQRDRLLLVGVLDGAAFDGDELPEGDVVMDGVGERGVAVGRERGQETGEKNDEQVRFHFAKVRFFFDYVRIKTQVITI